MNQRLSAGPASRGDIAPGRSIAPPVNVHRPLVSVVIPTMNRNDLLERCLHALRRQTISRDDYEIIVCDDAPSPRTRALVDAMAIPMRGRPRLQYVAVTGTQGPAGARNMGWRQARAPIIAFTDDDTLPEPGWLEAGLAAMASGAQAAAGRIVMPLPATPTDLELDAARLSQVEFATANCFVRRDALEQVGGFDERYTAAWREDSDLHFSLLERGGVVTSAPDAVVVHPVRSMPFAAGLRMQKKVMFDVLLYRKFPRLYRERIRRGRPWFYLAVSAALLSVAAAFIAGEPPVAHLALILWTLLTLYFLARRLRHSTFSLRNTAELLVTSVLIPPLSIFWRLVGASRFGWALP